MAEPAVIVDQEGQTLVVTLNRPEKRNAVNAEALCRLYDAWLRLDQDESLRTAILTGRGTAFCSGMDLAERGKMQEKIMAVEGVGPPNREGFHHTGVAR